MSEPNENKRAFAVRLNEALDLNNIPPKHQGRIQFVAEMFSLTHRGAGKWVNGLSLPPKKKRPLIAERLQVNYEWLEFGHGQARLVADYLVPSYSKKLPILQQAQLTSYPDCLKSFSGDYAILDVDVSVEAFVLYLDSTSTTAQFPEGTLLIFDPQSPFQDGDYVLVNVAAENTALFRQISLTEKHHYLFGIDAKQKPIQLSQADQVIAKMVQARMEFKA